MKKADFETIGGAFCVVLVMVAVYLTMVLAGTF